MDAFPDWQYASAFKVGGDVFRLLPAQEYANDQKVRKIVKSKKILESNSMFKYGEYLESLNEEMQFNADAF